MDVGRLLGFTQVTRICREAFAMGSARSLGGRPRLRCWQMVCSSLLDWARRRAVFPVSRGKDLMYELHPEFPDLLRGHDLEALNAHAGSIYGVWADYTLAYMNPAWFRFAEENQGEPEISRRWGLGASILDCCTGGYVRNVFSSWFRFCLSQQLPWEHDFECSSGDQYRLFHQNVYPLGRGEGLLIVNALRVEYAQQDWAGAASMSHYLDEDGCLQQCANCRRVRSFAEPERWDWVPDWVRHCPENISHTFCPVCLRCYYPLPESSPET